MTIKYGVIGESVNKAIRIAFTLILLIMPIGLVFSHSIVFVHIGKSLPTYLPYAFFQARLFNKECKIVLLANQQALDAYRDPYGLNITTVSIESLHRSKEHKKFLLKTKLKRKFRKGFWLYASERFFVLDEFMQQHNEQDVFHIESDVMVYVDFATLMPTILKHYRGVGLVLDNDTRCIPSIVYIRNACCMKKIALCFLNNMNIKRSDMEVLGLFSKQSKDGLVNNLPIIMPTYIEKFIKNKFKNPCMFSNNIDKFGAIFDGGALGQFVGGVDPRNGCFMQGWIKPETVFNPSHLRYEWQSDNEGRRVPYVQFQHEKYRINNLHIHCKNLKKYLSIQVKSYGNEVARKRDYVCGNAFRACADHIVEGDKCLFNTSLVERGDIIYVARGSLEFFFNKVFRRIANPFILITHNHDESSPGRFKKYLESPQIIKWFGENSDVVSHEKFVPIPIGIANEKWLHGRRQIFDDVLNIIENKLYHQKAKKAYMNFSTKTNSMLRLPILEYFKDKSFVVVAKEKLPQDYLMEMSNYWYVLSPHGNGLDCHRTWEALLVGSIPVVKSSTLDLLYKDLPVIIVADWKEVTLKSLEKKHREILLKTDWNFEKLYMPYWLDKIAEAKAMVQLY